MQAFFCRSLPEVRLRTARETALMRIKKHLILCRDMIIYLLCGASLVVEHDLPKVGVRVRFPCAALKDEFCTMLSIRSVFS